MRALDILEGANERPVKFTYAGQTWTGIRIQSRRKGVPTKLEISRWGGVVGAVEITAVHISPDVDVEPVEPASKPQATSALK